jgi:hypothetical protein
MGRFEGPTAATPFVSGKPFGARHLLEALAMAVEITFGTFVGARNPGWRDQLSISDYRVAWGAWELFFSSPLVASKVPDVWKNRIAGITRWSRPLEFYLAAELALWIPVGPGGVIVPENRSATWWDIHPGWRFLLILLYFRRSGLQFADPGTFPGTFEARYEQLQDEVCAYYGWPTPRALSALWQGLLLQVLGADTTHGYFIEVDSQRHKATGNLLLTRDRDPAAFTMTAHQVQGRRGLWFSSAAADDGFIVTDPELLVVGAPYLWSLVTGVEILASGKRAKHQRFLLYGNAIATFLANYGEKFHGIDRRRLRAWMSTYLTP